MTGIVSKTYKIIKKVQNEVLQSNKSNMQTAGMKTRSTMDNVIWLQNMKRSQKHIPNFC